MIRFLVSTLTILAASAAVTCHARPDVDKAQLQSRYSASDLATRDGQKDYTHVCLRIASSISPSAVHYPGSPVYAWLNSHWSASSDQPSACVAEPRSVSDVSTILRIIGQTRTPFAVQSGGHATNPGFSSTLGVHISLYSLRSIDYSSTSQTVEIGTGLKWDDVYAALEPHGMSVAGGRVTDVGVGGFTLGGGYSWKTNQHGLAIDTVTALELVKPNGDVVQVTEKCDSELFFGLKGASNNFGIVTKITLKTFAQGPGGFASFTSPQAIAGLDAATAKFSTEVKDPKASILSTFTYYQGSLSGSVQLFYDGPNPSPEIFDDIMALSSTSADVSTRSHLSLILSTPANATYGLRTYFDTLPVVDYSPEFLELVRDTSVAVGQELASTSFLSLSLVAEPFLPTILSHNPSRTAYPFTRSKMYTPFNIMISWANATDDEVIAEVVKKIRNRLSKALVAEGQSDIVDAPLYPNYALYDTPVKRIYGSNLPALKALKARVDPANVMGLAGGFKV
ncbi:hypothetical protein EST38_g11934 [Candolleomyces aberdarensis]|uniref:FAD-binding PCMH-type domain-containing protein n=1 Tax=Candolleomyces aberdarensis TaxID=2316362 RepID=A0A4V1Q256_9AGAR|nr:hypothetical protein EST38_g11934 [Candolleomyces aberdarensis]